MGRAGVGVAIDFLIGPEPDRVGESLGDESSKWEDDDHTCLRDRGEFESLPVEEFEGREDDWNCQLVVARQRKGNKNTYPE